MRALLLITLIAALNSACDGKPCAKPPDYAKYDQELDSALDELLDHATAYEHQRTRVAAINQRLAPARAQFRTQYERIRADMIDALVAVNPNAAVFRGHLTAMRSIFMAYVYQVIDASLPAHQFFTTAQRKAMTKPWEDPPEPFKLSWTTRRAIDLALVKISATDEQKARVATLQTDIEQSATKLLKDQHAVRMKLLGQWHQPIIDPTMVRRHIDEGAAQISTFLFRFADEAFEINNMLTPQQRMWTNQQINKMRRCST